jgi:hypothetical protein
LEIVNEHNVLTNAIGDAVQTQRPWTEIRDLARQMAQANDREARNLASTPWPARVSSLIDQLVRDDQEQQQLWDDAAKASDPVEFRARLNLVYFSRHGGGDEASQIRQILGLNGGGSAPTFEP